MNSESQPPSDKPIHPLERRGAYRESTLMTANRETHREPPPQAGQVRVRFPFTQPTFTYILLALNVLIYTADKAFLNDYLSLIGRKDGPAMIAGEYWRFITPIFLHGDFQHILLNSWSLWLFGQETERTYGHLRFLAIYFIAGVASIIASFLFTPAPALGASGAIWGLIMSVLPLMLFNRHIFSETKAHLIHLALIILANLLVIVFPAADNRIDHWGHIGGAIAGILLAWQIAPRYEVKYAVDGRPEAIDDTVSPTRVSLAIGIVGIFTVLIAVAALAAKMF